MKIFVTGGLGFIGSYLTDKLIANGHQVFVYDKIINFADDNDYYHQALRYRKKMFSQKPAKVYNDDIRKPSHLKSAVNDCSPDVVVHLAAVTMARPPKKFQHLMGPINLYGTLNVINAFEQSTAKRIIFPSSSLAYGHFVKNPQPEDSYLKPVNDYGIMKAACEYAVMLSKKDWVIVRPTSVYGFTDCANRVTQILWDAAINHKTAWIVRGETLDFTYVKDVIDGFNKVITSKAASKQVFNLSRGKSRTTEEFAQELKKYFPEFDFTVKDSDKAVVSRWTQDVTKAEKLLNFIPKYDIEDGIKDTVRLMKKYGQIS